MCQSTMEKREPMRTRHVPESTLVGEQHVIGPGYVADSIGGSERWAVDSGFVPLGRSGDDDHPRCRNGWTFRLVTDGLRLSGVDTESVEAPGGRMVDDGLTQEDGHIVGMDPEPTSAEACVRRRP